MKTPPDPNAPAFTRLIDLASSRLGGLAIATSDEFFAEKDNMLKTSPAIFLPDEYTDRGKWMDGWESRRKRVPGHDWCVLRLGAPGTLKGFDIDTSFFLGNHPPFASVEGVYSERSLVHTDAFDQLPWKEILRKAPLQPGSHNYFDVSSSERVNFLRLNIFPDGGVARFRAYGHIAPDWTRYAPGEVLDLAAVEHGGTVEACNDMFFGPKDNLIMPGRGHNMSDGWETKRKRNLPGHDWVVVRLGAAGTLRRVIVDTNNFKGNFPDRCSLEGCNAPNAAPGSVPEGPWQTIVGETKLMGHHQHELVTELKAKGPFTHVRMNIFPDGGVARLRLYGVR